MSLLFALRHVSALGLLLISSRFLFVEAIHFGGAYAPARGPATSPREEPARRKGPTELLNEADQARRDQIEQLEHELEAAKDTDTEAGEEPEVLQRHIVVDWGPERSDVYIDGKLVGKTPYGGQVACVKDGRIRVSVLPPKLAPLTRWFSCSPEPSAPGQPEMGRP